MTEPTPFSSRRARALAVLGRLATAGALIAVLVAALGSVSLLVRPPAAPVAGPQPEKELEAAPVPPGSVAPPVEPPAPVPEPGADPVREWANQVSAVVDVPARALVSYVNADLAMREYQPGCEISWATLAGIGRIESNHGRYGSRQLRDDARPSYPIIGIALDGGPGVRAIPDTDGGLFDADQVHDRAVGPMQFIPSTWRKWSTDGNGDGRGDPQNLDDAAMAAGRYLCAGGRNMTTGAGWWSGVMSYNNSVEYAQKVFALAQTYAEVGSRRQ